METLELWLLILTFTNTIVIGGFSLLRTYYQRKALKVQEQTLKESREYWNSWQTRSQNIALEVKEKMEMENSDEKDKESKRPNTGNKPNRSKAQRNKNGTA
jgi:hypothetical protein